IGKGAGEAKKSKKSHKRCIRDQALSFCTSHHLCRQGVALASTRQLRSQRPVSVHAYSTKEIAGSEGRDRANGVGVGIGDGRGIDDWIEAGIGKKDVNDDGYGNAAGTKTGVKASEQTQDGNRYG
ncbi:unnamed protein product, partial [Ascophyllum nodosum]